MLRRREEGVVVGMAMLGERVLVMGKDGSGGFGGFLEHTHRCIMVVYQ